MTLPMPLDGLAFCRKLCTRSTADGSELTDFVLSVFRDENASNKERMDAATWLADRGFGKPTVNAAAQAPGIGDFTIVIGDHDARGNPIIPAPSWEA